MDDSGTRPTQAQAGQVGPGAGGLDLDFRELTPEPVTENVYALGVEGVTNENRKRPHTAGTDHKQNPVLVCGLQSSDQMIGKSR
jgi:hypothetical protein